MEFWMPILGTNLAIRASVLDEQRAMRHHGQSLAELAGRGGLAPKEALVVAKKEGYREFRNGDSLELLKELAQL